MSKYKVGDKVRIVNNVMGYSEDFTGQECAVKDVTDTGVKLSVTYKDGRIHLLRFQNDMIVPVEKWIKWDGEGDMPVPAGTSLNVEYRNGSIEHAVAGEHRRGAFDWTHTDHPRDIVAYYVMPTRESSKSEVYSAEALNNNFKKLVEQATEAATATDILQEATECLTARAVERDREGGERSMRAAVTAFNALTGHELTEADGWLAMVCLKAARAEGGKFRLDDYIDGAAYFALYGEAASNANNL
jgi:cell division protein FtsL